MEDILDIDPSGCTINKLKSLLSENGVELPTWKEQKSRYIELFKKLQDDKRRELKEGKRKRTSIINPIINASESDESPIKKVKKTSTKPKRKVSVAKDIEESAEEEEEKKPKKKKEKEDDDQEKKTKKKRSKEEDDEEEEEEEQEKPKKKKSKEEEEEPKKKEEKPEPKKKEEKRRHSEASNPFQSLSKEEPKGRKSISGIKISRQIDEQEPPFDKRFHSEELKNQKIQKEEQITPKKSVTIVDPPVQPAEISPKRDVLHTPMKSSLKQPRKLDEISGVQPRKLDEISEIENSKNIQNVTNRKRTNFNEISPAKEIKERLEVEFPTLKNDDRTVNEILGQKIQKIRKRK
eukprot:TRINITY_DN2303_c0_g1_i1.p1 TRINITY_DN2303_c0_g1~~TRINITY_DN2303_c0_g1_i1.p1  ORF type:complete len:349 (+),score=146.21 TRINITY_DN2303_c0_g1_i1:126-1172(+)